MFTENLGQAAEAATNYFKRLCRWDGVDPTTNFKIFGHDLAPIEEEVSQIALFESQGIEGMSKLEKTVIRYSFMKVLSWKHSLLPFTCESHSRTLTSGNKLI